MAESAHHESFWDKIKHAFGGQSNDFATDEQYYQGRYASVVNPTAAASGTDAGMGAGMSAGAAASSGAGAGSGSYDHARPAYEFGHTAGLHPDAADRRFEDVEPELRRGWESRGGAGQPWDAVRGHVADAYGRGQERRIVLSEEQLTVGKRQVSAGEVELHTTVESERVRQQVQLAHDEVSIERRPLSAADAAGADLTIGEEAIRVPLTREEAVVDKRVVPVEEVVVRTNTVTENQTVEDTVRKERLVTEGLDQQRGLSGAGLSGSAGTSDRAGLSGAADRATNSGLLDRAADKLDDLKDRVDGNPASRPGPDATDRRI
jgi:uncharacterized protein (TIGR02271 family)